MSTNNATLFQIRLTLLLLILLLCALCCGLCLAFSGAVSNRCEDSGCCTEHEGCWCGKHLMYMTFICFCLSVTRVRDTYVRWEWLAKVFTNIVHNSSVFCRHFENLSVSLDAGRCSHRTTVQMEVVTSYYV